MNYENYLKLFLTGMIPVLGSVIIYPIEKKYMNKVPYKIKQLLFGVIFGGFAVIGTEYGININGYVMNARDAAPVCASLIFGAPAGIIAGLIGGIERWFSVYWGAGMYTRLGCTISTIIAGLFSALLKKYIFENHIPKLIYAVTCGGIVEVVHMTSIFVTHLNDAQNAFEVVKTCTIPMVSINMLAPGLACALVLGIKHKWKKSEKKLLTVSQVFQRRLLLVVVFAFLITNGFNFVLQQKISDVQIRSLLQLNIDDIKSDISAVSDNNLLKIGQQIADYLNKEEITEELLTELCNVYNVSEINIVNNLGIIDYSTNSKLVGYDMASGDQSREFLSIINDGINEYVQKLQKMSYDNSTYMKYVGVKLDDGGFVQVGYNEETFYDDLLSQVSSLAYYRHIGKDGHIVIVEEKTCRVVSDYSELDNLYLSDIGYYGGITNLSEEKIYVGNIHDVKSFYQVAYIEGYVILAYQPYEEALFAQTLSIYLTTFMEIIVYAVIFVLTFLVINSTVVKNINRLNKDLKSITEGNLDTVVDVRNNREFDSLSTGVNSTVDKLKELISEAEQRMSKELEYAADIQRAVLPSNFPAFPDRNDIDIYASMTPAKEVGGDFYDFYFVDANRLAILIADVSGKGVPASLFMMRAKTIIKSYVEYGIAVHDVFTNVNYNLCEGNDAGLFVTAWIGVIDLETGHLDYANAGHNPPLIKHKDGKFEYLASKPGFVLGGMEGVTYKHNELELEPGSEIFIYTDGVTEAQNINKELYGEERLLQSINNIKFESSQDTCTRVKEDVDNFVGNADQFDDLTMLHLKYIKKTFD